VSRILDSSSVGCYAARRRWWSVSASVGVR
jgi:hypothetical protein